MDMYSLEGKHVIFATIKDGIIYLATGGNRGLKLEPYGDCCACCFIVHVSGADALRDAKILGVKDMVDFSADNQAKTEDEDYFECDVANVFGHVISTDKGTCCIELRVEHNGYYGGSLEVSRCDRVTGNYLEDF